MSGSRGNVRFDVDGQARRAVQDRGLRAEHEPPATKTVESGSGGSQPFSER